MGSNWPAPLRMILLTIIPVVFLFILLYFYKVISVAVSLELSIMDSSMVGCCYLRTRVRSLLMELIDG